MNYYNPYYGMYPFMTNNIIKPTLISRVTSSLKGLNLSSILSGTGKTLNIVNQTIPLVKQATPVVKNAKTMFKIMNEFKKVDTKKIDKIDKKTKKIKEEFNEYKNNISNNGPTFFL